MKEALGAVALEEVAPAAAEVEGAAEQSNGQTRTERIPGSITGRPESTGEDEDENAEKGAKARTGMPVEALEVEREGTAEGSAAAPAGLPPAKTTITATTTSEHAAARPTHTISISSDQLYPYCTVLCSSYLSEKLLVVRRGANLYKE